MGSITIRIDDELEAKIDERRGDKPKSDFYRDILLTFVSKSEDNVTTNVSNLPTDNSGYIKSLEQQISMLKDQVTDMRANNGKLMTLLNQEQALHMQTQRLLPPAPENKWWQFWK